MEKMLETGKTKAIGVSNFSQKELSRVIDEATVVPAVHQLELHPWLQQRAFDDFHREKGIHITQYSPFGNQNEFYGSKLGKVMDDPVLVEIGKKYNKNGAQVALGEILGPSLLPPSSIRQSRPWRGVKLTQERRDEQLGASIAGTA